MVGGNPAGDRLAGAVCAYKTIFSYSQIILDYGLFVDTLNPMRTVVETPEFQKAAAKIWSQDELFAFVEWIASNPEAGTVIPGADGARKVRWSVAGRGKRGGVRVIYFNLNEEEIVLLVTMYSKSDRDK